MKTKNVLALVLVMLCIATHAQNVKEPNWVTPLGGAVSKIYNTQLNLPLIQLNSGTLVALEPATGAELWRLDRANPQMEAIPGTPFAFTSVASNQTLVDLSNGKTLNVQKEIQGKQVSWHLVPESYDLVIYSKDAADAGHPGYFLTIDLFAFAVRWNKPASFSDKPPTAMGKMAKMGLLPSSS